MSKFALFNNLDDFNAWFSQVSLGDYYLRNHPDAGDDRFYCVLEDSVDDSNLTIKTDAELIAMGFLSNTDYIINDKSEESKEFGSQLMSKFTKENIALGITQAGLSGHVLGLMTKKYPIPNATFPNTLEDVINSGTLTIAGDLIDYIIANENLASLAPFITTERLTTYKNDINSFLGV